LTLSKVSILSNRDQSWPRNDEMMAKGRVEDIDDSMQGSGEEVDDEGEEVGMDGISDAQKGTKTMRKRRKKSEMGL